MGKLRVQALCFAGKDSSSRAMCCRLFPVSKEAHFDRQACRVCVQQHRAQHLPELGLEYPLFMHWGTPKCTQFIFLFFSFFSFLFFNPSCEVTLSAFYVVILLIPVLNCSISLTRVHLCWPDSLIFHLSYIWNTDCRNGNKILQLWEVHACRADCWCQVQHAILFCWVWFLYFLK